MIEKFFKNMNKADTLFLFDNSLQKEIKFPVIDKFKKEISTIVIDKTPKKDIFHQNPITIEVTNVASKRDQFVQLCQELGYSELKNNNKLFNVQDEKIEIFLELMKKKGTDGSPLLNENVLSKYFFDKNAQSLERVNKLCDFKSLCSYEMNDLSKIDIPSELIEKLLILNKKFDHKINAKNLIHILENGDEQYYNALSSIEKKYLKDKNKNKIWGVVVNRNNDKTLQVEFKYEYNSKKPEITKNYCISPDGNQILKAEKSIEYKIDKNKSRVITKTFDTQCSTFKCLEMNNFLESNTITKNMTYKKDYKGRIIVDHLTPSGIGGDFNLQRMLPDGIKVDLCTAVKNKNGGVTVTKNFESAEGIKTKFSYYDDAKGNRLLSYKIIDKDGKLLLNNKEIYKILPDGTAVSSVNGETYKIKFEDNYIHINDVKTGEAKCIDMTKFIATDNAKIDRMKSRLSYQDRAQVYVPTVTDVKELLQKISAKDIIKMDKNGVKLLFTNNSISSFLLREDFLHMLIPKNDFFVFKHELGHQKSKKIFDEVFFKEHCKEINKICNEEIKNLNTSSLSSDEKRALWYFIDQKRLDDTVDVQAGLAELIAEADGIFTTYQTNSTLKERTHLLLQHFPRTITEAKKFLE